MWPRRLDYSTTDWAIRPRLSSPTSRPIDVFARVFQPSVIMPAGSVKLGVTAVIDPDLLEHLNDPDKNDLLPKTSIKRPEDVLPAVIADLESRSDFQVLMVQGKPELARSLARAFPGFDVVVSTSPADDVLNREAETVNDGKTMIVIVGKKGKNVGLVGIYPDGSPACASSSSRSTSNSTGPPRR